MEDETEKRLQTLKAEGQKSRRRMEKIGGMILSGISLLVVAMFLWILAMSRKQPMTITITLIVIAGSLVTFTWGLKMIIFGKHA